MSIEGNKALARRGLEEVLNQKNLAVLDELVVPFRCTKDKPSFIC